MHSRTWNTFLGMTWRERLLLAAVALAGFVAFYFLSTRQWQAAVVIPVYLGLVALAGPGVMSLYRRYDVRCLAKALRLRRALRRNEIVLHYQPKVGVETGELSGVEVLARWEHPRRGLLPPGEFIAAAEGTWLAKQFDLYVVRRAIEQGLAWERDDIPVMLCVNVCPRVLASTDFAEAVRALLMEIDYPPKLLDLEVTESALADSRELIRSFERLAALGVRLTLDDFGTGHSSLRRLVDLPVGVVKIDRSFVLEIQDEANAAVVRATTALAHSLDRTVCAEGVETDEAWHRVRALGCDVVQGFLIAKPMRPREFAEWARRSTDGRAFVDSLRAK